MQSSKSSEKFLKKSALIQPRTIFRKILKRRSARAATLAVRGRAARSRRLSAAGGLGAAHLRLIPESLKATGEGQVWNLEDEIWNSHDISNGFGILNY